MMNFQVIDIRLLPGNRPLRAFADVKIENLVIRDFRVIQSNGKPYVRAPFTTYKNRAGTLKFRQIIDLPDEVRGQIDTIILSEYYRREKEEKGGVYGR